MAHISSAVTTKIFRHFADADGDGYVGANDFILFRLRFGGSI
jgi:hypothetical protein